MITELMEPFCQEWTRIEHDKLNKQSRGPEDGDEETERSRQRLTVGHRVSMKKRQDGKGDDRHHDKHAVDPKQSPQEWMK